jgi:hypothetical protein
MKRLALFLILTAAAYGQGFRTDSNVLTTNGNVPSGAKAPVMTVPGSTLSVCSDAACSISATTYSDITMSTPCPSDKPITLPGSTTCVASADSLGRFGFWTASSTFYYKITTPGNLVYGPYPVTTGISAASLAVPTGSSLVGFLQAGTGATTRTIQAKSRDIISVMDFGCKGDNSTDDTACFNAALTYAATLGSGASITGAGVTLIGGSEVIMPAPPIAYKIAGTVSFPATAFGIGLIGDGPNNTWINCTGASDCLFVPHMFSNNASVTLEKFTVNCPGTCAAGANGIHMVDVVGSRWKDVHVQNFTGASGSCAIFQNSAYWTERNFLRAVTTYNCNKGIRFLKNAGDSFNSFGYNELDIQQNINDGQIGFSVEGGAYVYNGKYRFTANLNQTSNPTYYVSVTGNSTFGPYGGESACEFMAEGNSGAPLEFNVGTGNVFGCTGFFTTGMAPGVTTGVTSQLPKVQNVNKVETTHNLGAGGTNPGGPGTWLIPNFGASNGFCEGVGFNVFFDHFGINGAAATNKYVAQGDGSNNGGSLMVSCAGAPSYGFYIFPTTGGANQLIDPTTLSSYVVMQFSGAGGSGTATAVNYVGNKATLNGNTANLNLQPDPLSTGSYVFSANGGGTIQPLRLTGSPITMGGAIGTYTATMPSTGGMQLLGTLGLPSCNVGNRGLLFYTAGNAGFKDGYQVCAKDATDTYAWRTIY